MLLDILFADLNENKIVLEFFDEEIKIGIYN